jgi:sialic acid synthase SpsE
MSITIGHRRVGPEEPLFVIAELGINHGGDLERALALVDAAATAGASAVKLQCFHADQLIADRCPPPRHLDIGSMRDYFRRFELGPEAHEAIFTLARASGLAVMATPFDAEAVEMLEMLDCDAYKIASGDLTHDRLIERVAATGRPVVLSTGMSAIAEVADAWAWARACGARQIALLHCVSAYPVPAGSENLSAVATLRDAFDVPVGLSDHGTDPLSVAIAVTLGGSLYERHLMLEGQTDAADAAVSVTPSQLADLIESAHRVRRQMGDGVKVCQPAESSNLAPSRRSLYAGRALQAGERVTPDAIVALRPATGLDPRRWRQLVGVTLERDIAEGAPFVEADVERDAGQQEYRGVA